MAHLTIQSWSPSIWDYKFTDVKRSPWEVIKEKQYWLSKDNERIKVIRVGQNNVYYIVYAKDKRWIEMIDPFKFIKYYKKLES